MKCDIAGASHFHPLKYYDAASKVRNNARKPGVPNVCCLSAFGFFPI